MQFTQTDLENLSVLARLSIGESEKEKMLHDMQAILGYVSEVNGVILSEAIESYGEVNIVREDIALNETGLKTEKILANAPEREGDYVKVTQVLK